ncbi:MAG: hypothetical protein LWX52_12475 [Deltaproteobacteria bacterium]|nr:hypothetical protein [Deltaproteobacteria bacterium]
MTTFLHVARHYPILHGDVLDCQIRAYQIVQSTAEKAGIEKARRHPHGFAVNAVTSGVPPMVLRN